MSLFQDFTMMQPWPLAGAHTRFPDSVPLSGKFQRFVVTVVISPTSHAVQALTFPEL